MQALPEGQNLLTLNPPRSIPLVSGHRCEIGGGAIRVKGQTMQVKAMGYEIPIQSIVRTGNAFSLVFRIPQVNWLLQVTGYTTSDPQSLPLQTIAGFMEQLAQGFKPQYTVPYERKTQNVTLSLV